MNCKILTLLGLFIPFLATCGGPTLESKAANAIQTLMANGAESFLRGGGATFTQECSGGGSFTYDPPDPSSFDPDDIAADLAVSFNNCIIKVCGDTLTFKSANGLTVFSLLGLDEDDAAELIGGGTIVEAGDNFFEIEVIAEDQPVDGFLKGKLNFGYKMRIIGNSEGLKQILIIDSENADPVKIQDKTLKAKDFGKLTDRC